MPLAQLREKITNRSARIGVIGLGYVGLPMAALFAQKGFNVTGVDLKQERIDKIKQGQSPIEGNEPGLADLLAEVSNAGKLLATTDYARLGDCDVVLIDVETPVNDAHIPEYHALKGAISSLSAVIKPGALVVVESTIMPGTMQKIVLPLLEAGSGGKCGQRFFLGNCPERVMPGKLLRNLQAMSRVVGGDSEETADTMRLLYKQIVDADVDAADWITAELVKTVENTYRDVQIAFANEVALICEALGADAWRVRELVRKSPGREMLLPGAGVGGHCIPKDPWLLASAVRDLDVDVRLIPTARAVNNSMPAHVLGLVQVALGNLSGKKVLVLGYAYLEDSDDTRNSPSTTLVELLENAGAQAIVHDPFVGQFAGDVYAMGKGCHAAVLMTAHGQYKAIDLAKLKSGMAGKIFVDCRNFWKNGEPAAAGFELIRLGDFSPRR